MDFLKLKSYAKINLSLKISGKRDDGYHLLEMINDQVSLCDDMSFKKIDNGIKLTCNINIDNKDNLVYKVAKFMFDKYNIQGGIDINLSKTIPTGAGLGGGSSNCATTIKAIDTLYELNLTKEEMAKIGIKFGADVPYFIYERPALVSGIGEIIEPFDYEPFFKVLIVKPKVSCNTKDIFSNYTLKHSDYSVNDLKSCLIYKNFDNISQNIVNSLENVAIKLYNDISRTKVALFKLGFETVIMTGSGACVIALFKDESKAKMAVRKLEQLDFIDKVFISHLVRMEK